MKFLVKILLLMCVMFFLEGCATAILSKKPSVATCPDDISDFCYVYSRSRFDGMMIYAPFWAFTPANDKNVGFAKEMAPIIGPFMVIGGIIDLPISVTVDTLTFPWDIWRGTQKYNIKDESRDNAPKTTVPKLE